MKRLTASEPIVAVEIVVQPIEVQHPPRTVPVQVRDAAVAARIAQNGGRQDDVLAAQLGGDLVALREEARHIRQSEVGLERHRAFAHFITADVFFAVLEERLELQLADVQILRRFDVFEHFPLVGDELWNVDLARELDAQLAELAFDDELQSALQLLGIERITALLPQLPLDL